MDTWRNINHPLKHQIELKMREGGGGGVLMFLRERERERGREVQDFFQRFKEFRRSELVKTKTKVHRLDEGYTHIQKMRDFTKDPNEKI